VRRKYLTSLGRHKSGKAVIKRDTLIHSNQGGASPKEIVNGLVFLELEETELLTELSAIEAEARTYARLINYTISSFVLCVYQIWQQVQVLFPR
jgi:hypothetical protein